MSLFTVVMPNGGSFKLRFVGWEMDEIGTGDSTHVRIEYEAIFLFGLQHPLLQRLTGWLSPLRVLLSKDETKHCIGPGGFSFFGKICL
jgi:hypothetical protein